MDDGWSSGTALFTMHPSHSLFTTRVLRVLQVCETVRSTECTWFRSCVSNNSRLDHTQIDSLMRVTRSSTGSGVPWLRSKWMVYYRLTYKLPDEYYPTNKPLWPYGDWQCCVDFLAFNTSPSMPIASISVIPIIDSSTCQAHGIIFGMFQLIKWDECNGISTGHVHSIN